MARITIEDCTRREGNRFSLVAMVSVRTKQLMRGARPLVRSVENKAVVTALREVAAGHIRADLEPEPGDQPGEAGASS